MFKKAQELNEAYVYVITARNKSEEKAGLREFIKKFLNFYYEINHELMFFL